MSHGWYNKKLKLKKKGCMNCLSSSIKCNKSTKCIHTKRNSLSRTQYYYTVHRLPPKLVNYIKTKNQFSSETTPSPMRIAYEYIPHCCVNTCPIILFTHTIKSHQYRMIYYIIGIIIIIRRRH